MTPVALVRGGAPAAEPLPSYDDAVRVRRAQGGDVEAIAAIVAEWAAEALLLPRSAAEVAQALDDYVVAVDGRGRVLACAALREYSPSLAEVVSVAVSRRAHGRGLGRLVVEGAERLAARRGHAAVFAHTLQPRFFLALGYEPVERGLYPEKRARPHTTCFRRPLGTAARVEVATAFAVPTAAAVAVAA